ncbi:HIT-like protein [Trametopsis cervina]|nr:HIT-like protein [Trametopsis cervina]
MAGPDLFALRTYASRQKPERISPEVYISHTDTTVAILDRYPKSIFHALVLPRPRDADGLTVDVLDSLRSLLRSEKAGVSRETARRILREMGAHAESERERIRKEMMSRYQVTWDVWLGFHAVPSMHHLHLHVLSADLHSPTMKHRKHYNSFHPKRGFFLHYEDVMSWFDAVPSFFKDKASLDPRTYEPLLKHDLDCFICDKPFKNMPLLKAHLQQHHEALYVNKSKSKAPVSKKRALEGGGTPNSKAPTSSLGSDVKRRKTDSPMSYTI